MKKIFGPIAAVIGFAAIASFILFVEMSPSTLNGASLFASLVPQNSPNLTADISSVFPGGESAAPDAAPVDQNEVPPAQPASEETIIAVSSTPISTPPPTSTSLSTPTSSFAVVMPTSTGIASTDSPESATPDFPEATATISVTPTAPTPTEISQPLIDVATGTTSALPYNESNFSGDTNWQTTWGSLQITGGGYLELSASPNSIGGTVYLKNAQEWSSYAMDDVVDLESGQSFALIADYADASNYVACEYTKTDTNTLAVQLVQYAHSYRIPLTSAVTLTSGAAVDLDVGIQTQGIYGSCALDGETITNQGMGPGRIPMASSWNGGIGFSVNDPTVGTSRLIVKSVSVK